MGKFLVLSLLLIVLVQVLAQDVGLIEGNEEFNLSSEEHLEKLPIPSAVCVASGDPGCLAQCIVKGYYFGKCNWRLKCKCKRKRDFIIVDENEIQ